MINSNKIDWKKHKTNNTIQVNRCNKSLKYVEHWISLLVCTGEPVKKMLQDRRLGVRRLLLLMRVLLVAGLLHIARGSWLSRHQVVVIVVVDSHVVVVVDSNVIVVVVDSHGLLHLSRHLFWLPCGCFDEQVSWGRLIHLLRSASCVLACCWPSWGLLGGSY